MKIMLVSGSIGGKSRTLALLQFVQSLLQSEGADAILWDLGEKPLPIAVPRYHYKPDDNPYAEVNAFNETVRSVDGFVLGSPLYHGSFSGVLKNALDSLPPKALASRPVALLSHSGNARSCVAPCDSLRPIVRSLGGYSIPIQTGTTDEDYKETSENFVLTNAKVKSRLRMQVLDLIQMAALLGHKAQ
jgi:NAD(P)H-dependent FMN reductase